MLQKVLSTIDIYIDTVQTIKLPLDEYRVRLLESFVLKKRLSDNPKDYGYEDYVGPYFKSVNFLNDYIVDFFALDYKKDLLFQKHWGNIYLPMERSHTRNQINPLDMGQSPDYTYIYGVDVAPDSCELVLEYDDHRRKGNTWHIPLENNKFIIFPSTQKYFISQNKSSAINVFLTTNLEIARQ